MLLGEDRETGKMIKTAIHRSLFIGTLLLILPAPCYSKQVCESCVMEPFQGLGSGEGHLNSETAASSADVVQLNMDELYQPWTSWSACSQHCTQERHRTCRRHKHCPGPRTLSEKRVCWKPKGRCAQKKVPVHRTSRRLEEVVYNILYYNWSEWSACTRACKRRRYRTCAFKRWCKNTVLLEEKRCYVSGTSCEKRYLINEDWNLDDEEDWFEQDYEDTPQKPEKDHIEEPVQRNEKKKHKKTNSAKSHPSTPPTYNRNNCGIRNNSASLRIVGGREARRGSWPWQVAVTTRWKEQYCGGALIAPQWVITAAHCVRKKGRRRRVLVRIGEHDLSLHEGSEQEMRILADYVHKDFNLDTIDSDIALLKLKTPVQLRKHIGFACLPHEDDFLPPKRLCYAIGWGKVTDDNLFGTDVLREARIPLVNNRSCQKAFDYDITANQMCAGYLKGGADTCAGDSGGPLMCQIERDGVKRWHVYGVTSFGEGCGDIGKYGIYTKVTNFVKWIQDTIQSN